MCLFEPQIRNRHQTCDQVHCTRMMLMTLTMMLKTLTTLSICAGKVGTLPNKPKSHVPGQKYTENTSVGNFMAVYEE